MFIAIVDLRTTASNRPIALNELADQSAAVRAMSGNRRFAVLVPPGDDQKLTVLPEWDDYAQFQGYLASDTFARFASTVRTLATEPPVSRRFEAHLVEQTA